MDRRRIAGLLLALCTSTAGAALAAPPPEPIVVPTLPPADPTTQAIVRAAVGALDDILARNRLNAANSARGTVDYFRRYDLQIRAGSNSYRDIHLHPGTVIAPRGATPGNGTTVEIRGQGRPDGSLDADTITVLQ